MGKIKVLIAVDKKLNIGYNNDLPWGHGNFPEDMKNFRAQTLGNIVVMGRGCWESLGSKPLPGRENWVITSSEDETKFIGAKVFKSMEEVLTYYTTHSTADLCLIGGRGIYEEAKTIHIDEFHLTEINKRYPGDAWLEKSTIFNLMYRECSTRITTEYTNKDKIKYRISIFK